MRPAQVVEGLNDTAENLLDAIKRNEAEIAPSSLYAAACIQEGIPFINGAPQNTFVPGLIDLAVQNKAGPGAAAVPHLACSAPVGFQEASTYAIYLVLMLLQAFWSGSKLSRRWACHAYDHCCAASIDTPSRQPPRQSAQQLTLCPAACLQVLIAGDDFKSGQTKLKSVLVDFLVGAGIKPTSIVSYNHLGNNDGMNLSAPQTFRSKEISKSNVVDDMVASNSILYSPGEHPDHVVVIKVLLRLLLPCLLLLLLCHKCAACYAARSVRSAACPEQ